MIPLGLSTLAKSAWDNKGAIAIALVVAIVLGGLGVQTWRIHSLQAELTQQKVDYGTLKTKYDTALNDLATTVQANNGFKQLVDANNAAITELAQQRRNLADALDAAGQRNGELGKQLQLALDKNTAAKVSDDPQQALNWGTDQNNEIARSWNSN